MVSHMKEMTKYLRHVEYNKDSEKLKIIVNLFRLGTAASY